ncbi:hypothetical protein EK21DRAFT_108946 [Setomelanomma holmii]|uniref:Uncharacterized protein n=1 Tax=Setomelanomma holmii TaxID=210430 RepID=A0A9P4LS67_9PLEO|nr:hypothetical protein EK21DRAFT_108946 [Setomelanomma holmii]
MDLDSFEGNMDFDQPGDMGSASAMVGFDPNQSTSLVPEAFHEFHQQPLPSRDDSHSNGSHFVRDGGMEMSDSYAPDDTYPTHSVGSTSSLAVPDHLQQLRDVYVASYLEPPEADPVARNEDPNVPAALRSKRMRCCKAFALALLQHYYQECEGYLVQPRPNGSMVKFGLNFMLQADDGSDSDYKPLPPRRYKKKDKKSLKAQQATEYLRQTAHWYPYTERVQWHTIEPDAIAGFEVLEKIAKTTGSANQELEYRIRTYLFIMIDDLQNFPLFRSGNGILLFGTRLEFYDFENGAETEVSGNLAVHMEEPITKLSRDAFGNELAMDLRTSTLQMADYAFKTFAGRKVVYVEPGQNGGIGDSEQLSRRASQQLDEDIHM